MSDNVYKIVGTRFTPDEYGLVQMGLTHVATQAKEHGETQVFQRAMDLMERLQQYVMAGSKVPPELDKQFAEQFEQALVENNSKATVVTIRRWIAARIRLEPDPAKAVAELVTRISFAFLQEGRNLISASALATVEKKLSALAKLYDADEEWPDGEDVLNYIKSWIAHGRTNLENGHAPWMGDADVGE